MTDDDDPRDDLYLRRVPQRITEAAREGEIEFEVDDEGFVVVDRENAAGLSYVGQPAGPEAHVALEVALLGYRGDDEARRPWELLRAFVFALDAGVVPPDDILEAVGEGFRRYLEDAFETDRPSMDKALGLTAPGRGKSPPFAVARERVLEETLMLGIWRRRAAGMTLGQAAQEVRDEARTAMRGKPGAPNQGEPPAAETLARNYTRNGWAALFDEAARDTK